MTRDAVLRAVGQGRTTAEIAQVLQCSPSKASRALKELQEKGLLVQEIGERRRLVWRRV